MGGKLKLLGKRLSMLQWPVKPKAVLADVAGFSSRLKEGHGVG